jgi:predicted Zn-dependent peptidase
MMPRASIILACGTLAAAASGFGAPPPTELAPPNPVEHRSLWCENVVEMQTSRRGGVTSVWLSNGVRVHHLKLDRRPGQAVVTLTIAGGKLLEDAATRGLTDVAAGVLNDWDAAAPDASRRAQMAGRDLRIDAAASQDTITVRLSGSVADLEPGLSVAHALLTEPMVTPESVEHARDEVVRELRRRAADPRAAVSDAINSAILPAPGAGAAPDARLGPPNERSIGAMNVDQVRAWLMRHAREGGEPIEVAFVGDLALADALRLADGALGTLPKRARMSAQTHRAEQMVHVGAGAVRKDVLVASGVSPGRATVVHGCFGPDMGELADQRALRVGTRLAMARVKARLTPPAFTIDPNEPGGGVYISAFSGLGMALISVTVNAGAVEAAGAVIDEELARLADRPVEQSELEPVARELAKPVEAFERDPAYWSGALARCEGLGIDPDEILLGSAFYQKLEPQRVRDTIKKYLRADRMIGLTIRGPEKALPPPPDRK